MVHISGIGCTYAYMHMVVWHKLSNQLLLPESSVCAKPKVTLYLKHDKGSGYNQYLNFDVWNLNI